MSTFSPTPEGAQPGFDGLSPAGRAGLQAMQAPPPAPVDDEDHAGMRPRKALSLRQARRHQRRVRGMRRVLAACMGVQLALVIGFGVVNSIEPGAAFADSPPLPEEAVRMVNPRFTGRDAGGSPYVIVADAAERRSTDPQRLELTNPRMTVVTNGRQSFDVVATRGVFARERAILELTGDVCMKTISLDAPEIDERGCLESFRDPLGHKSGYAFQTSRARVFINSGRAEGNAPIDGSGPMGKISAQGFAVYRDERRVEFTGGDELRVVGRINQPPKLSAPPLAEGAEATGDGEETGTPDGAQPSQM